MKNIEDAHLPPDLVRDKITSLIYALERAEDILLDSEERKVA